MRNKFFHNEQQASIARKPNVSNAKGISTASLDSVDFFFLMIVGDNPRSVLSFIRFRKWKVIYLVVV